MKRISYKLKSLLSDLSDYLMIVIGFVLTVTLFGVIIGFPVKWLWNALIPDLFGGPTITFWQGIGLLILSGMLFKSSSGSKVKFNKK